MTRRAATMAPHPALGGARAAAPALPNAVLGMLVFLGAEVMFFAGLISAYLVLRASAGAWPPAGQPRLPVAVTAINTLVLLASGFTMARAVGAVRAGGRRPATRWLALTAALGTAFVCVQGGEWLRLVRFGLRVTSGTFGAAFYTLIGAHGVHVLGGVAVLLAVLWHTAAGRSAAGDDAAVEAARLYWFFVVGIWPVLYVLVYLT